MKGLCTGTYVHYRQKHNSSRWLLITGVWQQWTDKSWWSRPFFLFPLTVNWQWKARRWRNLTEPAMLLCGNWREILEMCESDSSHVLFNSTQRLNFFKRVSLYSVIMWFCEFKVKHFLSMYRFSSCNFKRNSEIYALASNLLCLYVFLIICQSWSWRTTFMDWHAIEVRKHTNEDRGHVDRGFRIRLLAG